MSRSRTSPEDTSPPGGLGLLIVLAGPSGTGKSSILRRLFDADRRLAFSVSHTTRPARSGEVDGQAYHFVDDARFDAMVASEAFAEWAHVHGQRYGTSHAEIRARRQAGHDIIFDIDVQGAENLCAVYPEAISVFVMPPSLEVLEARLRGRGTETEANLATRLGNARTEIARAGAFSYFITNTTLEDAAESLRCIIEAERHRAHHHADRPARLLAGEAIA